MPDVNVSHFDRALTTLSIKRKNSMFVHDQLFGEVPVDKQSNKYFIYGDEAFYTIDDTRRPAARANEIDWTLSSDTYYAEGHALAQVIADEQRANADQPIDMDADTVATLTDLISLQKEIAAANLATNTANFGAGNQQANAGGNLWSDTLNSNPVADVENAKPVIQEVIGQIPNSLLISYPVFVKLRNNQTIIERFKYSQVGIIQPEHLKSVFNVDNLIIASALSLPAPLTEGVVNTAKTYVWGKNALLFYKPPAMGLRTVALGAEFRWLFGMNRSGGAFPLPAGDPGGPTNGWLVKRWREEGRTGDQVEVQSYHAFKLISSYAGFLFPNVIA